MYDKSTRNLRGINQEIYAARGCYVLCILHTFQLWFLRRQHTDKQETLLAQFVCLPHDKTKTAEIVKGQGHKVTKCKNTLKAIEWLSWCTLTSANL